MVGAEVKASSFSPEGQGFEYLNSTKIVKLTVVDANSDTTVCSRNIRSRNSEPETRNS